MIGRDSSSSTATTRQVVATIAAALLIGSCIGVGAASSSSTNEIYDLDEDTELTDKSSWEAYQSSGVATADVAAPKMSITVAKEQEGVNLDGWHNDYSHEYLRVEYDEDIERTIRFYVPSNYFSPYFDEAVDAENADVSAKLVPVDAGRYTAVTITFTGPTDAVFKISETQGKTWDFWSDKDERLENVTGWKAGIAGEDQWNYPQESDWSEDGTLRIENVTNPDRVAIEYDAEVSSDNEAWLRVPEGEDGGTPVYYFVRDGDGGENATVVVVSKQDDPPAVRLKKQATAKDGIGAVWNDMKKSVDRAKDFFDSLLS